MKRFVLAFFLLATFSSANVAHASPITLDFNSVPQNFFNSLTEDGFTLATDKSVTLGFGTGAGFCSPDCAENGTVSARLFDNSTAPLAVFDLVKVGGGAFQFLGFDLGEGFMGIPQQNAISVTVTGFLSGSPVASQTFVLDAINDGPGGFGDFQSFVASGFTNVDRLVFLGNAGSQGRWFSMDDILLDTQAASAPGPEPLSLLALAFASIATRRFQNRR